MTIYLSSMMLLCFTCPLLIHCVLGKRQQLAEKLAAVDTILGFVTCVTAMAPSKAEIERRKRKRSDDMFDDEETNVRLVPGVSFWVMASCPETELRRLESDLQNLVLSAGLSLSQCSVIRPKGNCYVLFRYTYIHTYIYIYIYIHIYIYIYKLPFKIQYW